MPIGPVRFRRGRHSVVPIRQRLRSIFGDRPSGRTVSVRTRGGGGGGQAINLSKLLQQFQSSQSSQFANLLAAQREGASRARKRLRAARKQLRKVGGAEFKRISQEGERMGAQAQQSLASRGLSNTTIREAQERGIASDVAQRRAELTERLASMRAGLEERAAGLEFGLGRFGVETLQQGAPNIQQFLSLIQSLGGSGARFI